MSRRDPDQDSATRTLSPLESEQVAKDLARLLVDPNQALRRMILRGFRNPTLMQETAKEIGIRAVVDKAWIVRFAAAVERRNKQRVVDMLTEEFAKDPPTPDVVHGIKELGTGRVLRKALLEAANDFKGSRGRPANLDPNEFSQLAERADQLRPVLERILQEKEDGTKHTTRELLEFWAKDHPEACLFLLRNLQVLEQALADKDLLKRAKGISTHATLLADALAGAEAGYTLRSSLDRVRAARRASKREKL